MGVGPGHLRRHGKTEDAGRVVQYAVGVAHANAQRAVSRAVEQVGPAHFGYIGKAVFLPGLKPQRRFHFVVALHAVASLVHEAFQRNGFVGENFQYRGDPDQRADRVAAGRPAFRRHRDHGSGVFARGKGEHDGRGVDLAVFFAVGHAPADEGNGEQPGLFFLRGDLALERDVYRFRVVSVRRDVIFAVEPVGGADGDKAVHHLEFAAVEHVGFESDRVARRHAVRKFDGIRIQREHGVRRAVRGRICGNRLGFYVARVVFAGIGHALGIKPSELISMVEDEAQHKGRP